MNNQESVEQRQPLWTREFILIMMANLFVFLGFQMLLPTLPMFVTEKLGGQETIAGTVIGVFTVSSVLIRPFAGRFVDSYGRRTVYLFGLIVFLLCVLAYNWVPTILILLMIRFVHGFGWGVSTTASSTIASDVIPRPRLGEGMGYYGMTSTIAMAIAPLAGLALVSGGTFTSLFAVSAVFTALAFGLALLLRNTEVRGQPAGPKGSLFERSALLATFIVFFLAMTYGAVVSFIPIYAAQSGVTNVGPFFTVFAITLFVIRSVTGRVADKKGFTVVIVPGLAAVMAAMFTLYQANSLWLFLLAGVFYGLGFGAVQPALQAMAVRNVQPLRRGAANATFLTGFDLGIGTGSIMWGAVAEFSGFSVMYLSGIIPTAVALGIYWLASRRHGSAV